MFIRVTKGLVLVTCVLIIAWFLLSRPALNLDVSSSLTLAQKNSSETLTVPTTDTKREVQTVTAGQSASPTSPAVSQKLSGIDVSQYQGKVDWGAVKDAGIGFVYLKATEGEHTKDRRFKNNAAALDELGIPYGAYHFFEPREKGDKQAKHFLDNVSVSNQLPPVIDIETQAGVHTGQIKVGLKLWLSAVETNTGCKPIIYTYKSYWEKHLGDDFNDYALWLADYADHPTLPQGVENWVFWQHSEKGTVNGIRGNVDMDYFSGDLDALESHLCQ